MNRNLTLSERYGNPATAEKSVISKKGRTDFVRPFTI
jgi:hypothetical protein